MIAVALGLAVQVAIVQHYSPRLTAREPEIRADAIRQLSKVAEPADVWDRIWLAIKDEDRTVRLAAIDYYAARGSRDQGRGGMPDEYDVRVCEKLQSLALGREPVASLRAAKALAAAHPTHFTCRGVPATAFSELARSSLLTTAKKRPQVLFRVLEDPSNIVFGNAMWALADVVPVELESRLLSLVDSKDHERSALAIRGIHKVDKSLGRQLGLDLMKRDDLASQEGAAQMVADDPWFVQTLLPNYGSLDRSVRSDLIQAQKTDIVKVLFGMAPVRKANTNLIRVAILDPDDELRALAWDHVSLEEVGRDAVYSALRDRNSTVRYRAGVTLTNFGDESDLAIIEAHYNREGYDQASSTSLAFYAERLGTKAEPYALRLLAHRDPFARSAALEVIAVAKIVHLKRKAIAQAIKDPSDEVRRQIAWMIGAYKDTISNSNISTLVQDRSARVRLGLAYGLDDLKGRAIPFLKWLAADADKDVRSAAKSSLSSIKQGD